MRVEHVEFVVEEPSMEAFLSGLVPRLLGEVPFSIHPFQCKDELLDGNAMTDVAFAESAFEALRTIRSLLTNGASLSGP